MRRNHSIIVAATSLGILTGLCNTAIRATSERTEAREQEGAIYSVNTNPASQNVLPPASCNLTLASPVKDWWEALPLGNGQLGALIWGHDNRLTVKLDRLDVWDERGHPLWKTREFTWKTIQEYIEVGNFGRIHEIYDNHYWNEPPTHVAMGKVELALAAGTVAKVFRLDLAKAEVQVDYQDDKVVKAIASATEPVIMMQIPEMLEQFEMWAPGMNDTWDKRLRGYPSPVMGQDADSRWYTQAIPEGPTFMIFAKSAIVNGNTVIAMTVTTNQKDGADPLAAARKRVDQALGQGYEKMQAAHQKFWAGFWATSAINIPDQAALKHYYLTRYYFGASSRPGFPAMAALESVWTDDMMFPSFKNDLHNDLETQVQYQSYQTAGNFAEGEVFFEYLWNLLPTFRTYARSFYETGGAAVPGVMTYGGNPTTGWPQYCMSPTMAGWLGWLFYEHWRYTQDEKFLKERAYPWCVEIAECWSGLLKRDEKGILKLPLSASSEVFDNSPRAWLKPNCNYDLDMMQAHLFGTVEMARALGKPDEAQRWEKMATSLGPRHVDEENALMWSENEKVTFLHRHLSHSMSIQPFNLLTVEGSDEDRKIVAATSKRYDQCFAQGGDWAGWSYPWMSSWRSRIGQAENAYMYLDMFLKAFITRNGFHMNTSMNKAVKGGHGWLFTIEANILATQAVHDMLIQSWAPSIGKGEAGIIRLFPATAWSWHEASFKDLRAEGGFKVSAKRVNNATVWFQVTATANGLLRIRDNFGGRALHWKNRVMKKSGPNYELELKKGESTEATLDVPDAMPPKPADVYTPLAPSE